MGSLRLGVNTAIGEQDVLDDLAAIFRMEEGGMTRRAAKQARTLRKEQQQQQTADGATSEDEPQQEQPVRVQNDTLYFHDQSFRQGESLIIKTPDSSEFQGVLSACGLKDIWVRIDDGAKLKITLQQLQAGKYSISAPTPSQAGSSK